MKTKQTLGALALTVTVLMLSIHAGPPGMPVVDRDGDGSPDAEEYFIGTDPDDPESVFKIGGVERVAGPGGTMLRWHGLAGRGYRVEASQDLAPDSWEVVREVVGADGPAEVEIADAGGKAFYRVVTDMDTSLPPWIGMVEAPGGALNSPGPVVLRVQAWHPLGIDHVVFRLGERILGGATDAGDGAWELAWSPDPADNGAWMIRAEAVRGDTLAVSAGVAANVDVELPPQPAYLLENSDQFVLLDAEGNPQPGRPVRADAAGNLPPCEYRPLGGGLRGVDQSLAVRLPVGARIAGTAEQPVLEFNASSLVSGPVAPLAVRGAFSTNSPASLPLGPLPVGELAALYSLTDGAIPIAIFGLFPAELQNGILETKGLVAPWIAMVDEVLPIGEVLGGFEDYVADLLEPGFIKLPIKQSFAVGPKTSLHLGADQPAWVRFGFDGSLQFSGKAELAIAGGPSFGVGMTWMDPFIALDLSAKKMHARVSADWLKNLMPASAVVNGSTDTTVNALDTATLNLKAKSELFEKFSITFKPSSDGARARREEGAATSPLQLVGLAKFANASGITTGADQFKEAVRQAGRAASAATSAPGAAAQWFYIEKVRLGNLTDAEVDLARSEARAALRRRLEGNTPLSLVELEQTLEIALERWKLAQQLGVPIDHDGLEAAFTLAIGNAISAMADSLGADSGTPGSPAARIAARDRFVLYQDVATLTRLRRTIQQLGLPMDEAQLTGSLLPQIAAALEPKLRAALVEAENATNDNAFLDAMFEYLYLIQQDDLGALGTTSLSLLSSASLAARAAVVAEAFAALPRPQRPLARRLAEVKRLGDILDSLPPSVTYPAPPLERAYNGLLDSITPAFVEFNLLTLDELLDLLRAGNASVVLRDRMGFAPGTPAWEHASRLPALCDALAARCVSDDAPDVAGEAVASILAMADTLVVPGDQTRRRSYLIEAQKFTDALRVIALSRTSTPLLVAADAVLVGGLQIDEIAGGFTYDYRSKRLTGHASGKLRMPGLGSAFTLKRASFSNEGEFDLECYGSVNLPPGENAPGRFSVTERRPLKISWRRGKPVAVAGGGKLEVNGMTFEAWASANDPEYVFGAKFSGMDFDLANSLRVMVPAPPATGPFTTAAKRDLNRWFRTTSGAFEGLLEGAISQPVYQTPGAAPEVSTQEAESPYQALAAWARTEIADAALGMPRNFPSVTPDAIAQMRQLSERFGTLAPEGDCEAGLSSYEAAAALETISLIRQAIEIKQIKVPPEPVNEIEAQMAFLENQERSYLECLFSRPNRYSLEVENLAFNTLRRYLRPQGGAVPTSFDVDPEWTLVFEAAAEYHKRTVVDALDMCGINPLSALPAGDGVLLTLISDDELKEQIMNFHNRRALASLRQDGEVPYDPSIDWQLFGEQVQVTLMLEWRKRIIVRHWKLMDNFPTWTPGEPNGNAFVPAAEAVKLRAFGEEYREAVLDWLEFRKDFTFLGLGPALGMRAVLDPVTRDEGSWSLLNDAALDSMVTSRLLQACAELGEPVIVVQAPITMLGGVAKSARSYPIEEGMRALGKARTAYSPDEQAEIFRRPVLSRISLDTLPPDVAAGFERVAMARAGILPGTGQMGRPLLDALIEQVTIQRERFESLPAAERDTEEGLAIARDLRFLALALETANAPDAKPEVEAGINSFDAAFKESCVVQKATSPLAAYTDIWIEGSTMKVLGVVNESAGLFANLGSDSLRTSLALIGDLGVLLELKSRPLDLALPGDLKIEEVAGEVRYNRLTNHISAVFSGSLAFPNVDARFAVTNLSLTSDGELSISANTNGPLPGRPEVRLGGTLDLTGNFRPGTLGGPPVIVNELEVAGTGSMDIPGGASLNGSFSYNSTTRVFELVATGEHLDLTLGDHFALLSGEGRMRFGGVGAGTLPSTGLFELGGTFGLMRRTSPAAGQPLSEGNFHLAAVDTLARLEFDESGVTVSLPQGKLLLPDCFSSPPTPPSTEVRRGEISIDEVTPPSVVVSFSKLGPDGLPSLNEIQFMGLMNFENIGLQLPDFPEVRAQDFNGHFDFGKVKFDAAGHITAAEAPTLFVQSGLVQVPHPRSDQPDIGIEVDKLSWQLDGFPSGTLSLANDVILFEGGGLMFAARGGEICTPGEPSTGIRILPAEVIDGVPQPPRAQIFGAIFARFESSVITKEAGSGEPNPYGIPATAVAGAACGRINLFPDRPPTFDWSRATIGGRFQLGGPNGVAITGVAPGTDATLIFDGIGKLFALSPDNPFVVTISGKFHIPNGPAFGLNGTRFTFFNPQQPPQFFPGTLEYDASNWNLAQMGMVNVSHAELTFGDKPWPELLQPTNLTGKVSVNFGLPNVAQGEKIIGGTANNVEVKWKESGMPSFSLEGLGFELNPGLKIPPFEAVSGGFYLGGLDDPAKLSIAGRFRGKMKHYQVGFVAGFGTQGFLGLALDVNAGAAGIPIGGPTGIIFTGASGGVSFVSDNPDPSDFSAYATYNPVTNDYYPLPVGTLFDPPRMNWNDFRESIERIELQLPLFNPNAPAPPAPPPPATATTPISCPVGCPPPTVNVLCQPHPDQTMYPRRVILKFSAVDKDTLNDFYGITEQSVTQFISQGVPGAIDEVVEMIRAGFAALVPIPDPAYFDPAFVAQHEQNLDSLREAFREALYLAAAEAGASTGETLYQVIETSAWKGIDCRDINLMISGTFSHLAVSSFMGVTGQGLVSTTGAAGVSGMVNFLGIPVGEGLLFATATDNSGYPNPSICGNIRVGLPPFEFGRMGGSLRMDGCIAALLGIFNDFASAVGPQIANAVLAKMNPEFVGKSLNEVLAWIASENPDDPGPAVEAFMIAFMGQVLSDPDITLPVTLFTEMRTALGAAFDAMNPEFVLCGQVRPSIFGLETSEAVVQAKYRLRKTGREAQVGISPIGIILKLMQLDTIFTSVDQATIGYGEEWPDPAAFIMAGLDGTLADPERLADLARATAENMLTNSTATFEYELRPLGMKLANGEGRVIMPDVLNHPLHRTTPWVRPGEGVRAGWPSRLDFIATASKAGRIGDTFWKGTTGQLAELYADDPAKAALLANASLRGDYFPHGGFVFGGQINVPRILTTIPKEELALLSNTGPGWDSTQGLIDRLQAGLGIIQDYILTTEEKGNLTMYVPAPNPPAFLNPNGTTVPKPPMVDAAQVMDSFTSFDSNKLTDPDFYPFAQGFIKGRLEGTLLDIELGVAELEAQPADENGPARFYLHTQVPTGTWLDTFLNTGTITASLVGEPELDIELDFVDLAARIDAVIDDGYESQRQALLNEMKNSFFLKLPRTELIATAPTLRTPPGLESLLTFNGAGEFRAYTPEFDPMANPSHGPLAAAKKRGGIAFVGTVKPGPFGEPITANLSVTPNESGQPRLQGNFMMPKLVLPGSGIAPVNFVTSNASIDTGADGLTPTVSVTGTLGAGFTLPAGWNPWPVVVPTGAQVTITNHTMTISFNQSGYGAATVTVNATDPLLPVVTATARASIPAFSTGVVFIEGNTGNGHDILVNVNSNGTALATNARVRIGGAFNRTANLPQFTFDSSRNFTNFVTIATPQSGSLGGLSFTGLTWQVRRVSGVLSLQNLAGTLSSFPGMNAANQVFSGGTINASGAWAMSGLRPDLRVGNFVLRAFSGNLSVAVSSAISGVRLTGAYLEQGDLFPAINLGMFDLPVDGAFSHQVSAGFSIRGYALGTCSLRFQRVSGVTTLQVESSAFAPSGWPTGDALNLTGSIASNGGISLSQGWASGIVNPGPRDLFAIPIQGSFSLTTGESYTFVMANQAPAGWWPMNESVQSSPVTVVDSSGNGRNGNGSPAPTVNQPGFRSSAGTAYRFDGVDDRVIVPPDAAFDGANAISVSAWIRVNAFDKGWQTVVAKGDSAWRIARAGSTNQIAFDSNHASGLNSISSTTNVNNGQWHHVVGVWDGSRKYLYVNGVLEAASGAIDSPINTNIFAVGIGENTQATGRYWNGWIDEVAIFGRAINVTEVQRQYASGVGARMTFSGDLRLRTSNPALISTNFNGHVLPSGRLDFIGTVGGTPTVLGYGFKNVSLALSRSAGGTTASCTGRLTLHTLKAPGSLGSFNLFGTDPTLNAVFARSGSSMFAAVSASGVTTPLGGYAPTSTGYSLTLEGNLGTAQTMSLSAFNFGPFGSSAITNIGFGSLAGTIYNDGAFWVGPYTRSLTLRNLTASSTTVNFSHTGLSVNGSFALNIQPPGKSQKFIGNIGFGGIIQPGGTYTLNGTGSLNLGGFLTNSFAMTFRDPTQGATIVPAAGQSPLVNFGALPVPMVNMQINRTSFLASMEVEDRSTGWNERWVVNGVTWVRDKFDWSVHLEYDFTGDVHGSLTGFATGMFTCDFLPAAPKPAGAKTTFEFPASWSIGSGGDFTVNAGTTGLVNFKCPDWSHPAPGWTDFNIHSFGFDLW